MRRLPDGLRTLRYTYKTSSDTRISATDYLFGSAAVAATGKIYPRTPATMLAQRTRMRRNSIGKRHTDDAAGGGAIASTGRPRGRGGYAASPYFKIQHSGV